LLDEQLCEFFREHGVKVGISIDGDRAANDRHRRYADGRSSYDKVIRAIGLLRSGRFRELYAGLLCTIDVANDPLVVYESLIELDPPRVDFLLPHATWDRPPFRAEDADSEYADWLIAIYDRWLADGQPTQIRTFDSIMSTLKGGESLTEALGLGPTGLVVVETDGSYEQVDSLKAAYDGAPETGLNVFDHTLDVVAIHPGILARQQGIDGLCQTCQQCPVVSICGGGLYTHRYRASTGFANPSVFCADLLKLINHISSHLPEEASSMPETQAHVIRHEDFQALASGLGGASAVATLIESQRSLLRALLGAVYQAGATTSALSAADQVELRAAWSALSTIDRDHPEALTAVLDHPYIRPWAIRCLDQFQSLTVWADDDDQAGAASRLAADLGHLGGVAAAAAIKAETNAAVTIPVVENAIHLPTLGRLVVGIDEENSAPRVASRKASVEIISKSNEAVIQLNGSCWTLAITGLVSGDATPATSASNRTSCDWQPVRMLTAPGIRVALEDTDPYRDCHQWPALPRLTDSEYDRWREQFQEAWREIEDTHAAYAPALAAGLTTLMPLAPAKEGSDVSATARDAFGAVAAALPADPVVLALLLIHEFQHVKLGAVLDLYDLYDRAHDRLYYAPWRDDKRPLEGLLQGTYAHLAVTEFWRARQRVTSGPTAAAARERFLHWRAHTRDAIGTLIDSGSLTSLGTRFVGEMRSSVRL
jgi:uncharacterized protein